MDILELMTWKWQSGISVNKVYFLLLKSLDRAKRTLDTTYQISSQIQTVPYNSVPKQWMQLKCLALLSIPIQWPVLYSKACHTALVSQPQVQLSAPRGQKSNPLFIASIRVFPQTSVHTYTHSVSVTTYSIMWSYKALILCTEWNDEMKMKTVLQEQVWKPHHGMETDTKIFEPDKTSFDREKIKVWCLDLWSVEETSKADPPMCYLNSFLFNLSISFPPVRSPLCFSLLIIFIYFHLMTTVIARDGATLSCSFIWLLKCLLSSPWAAICNHGPFQFLVEHLLFLSDLLYSEKSRFW